MASLVFSAIQTGFRQLKEKGCWSLTLHTQEIEIEKAMQLSEFTSDMIKVLITDQNITDVAKQAVESVEIENSERFTASQRLRFAIEGLARRKNVEDVEEYYQTIMSKLIQIYNDK